MIDYKKVGLKAGLEVHLQLDTKYKLFCNSSAAMKEKEPIMIVIRKQHPVASELGEVDRAAQFEYLKDRTFYYQVFANESCIVELDESPPQSINQEALRIALQIALMLNCKIPDEIQVMRKTVIDGSNPSSFQRTAIVGTSGFLEYKNKKVEIAQVTLEEDAAALVSEEDGKVTYRLNRLGVPLVEIDTGILVGYGPEEVQEIAYLIGMVGRSTGKTKIGIGSIRQDVNVSIAKGARVEIKGVQELGTITRVIENEIKRQLSEKVKEETRAALPDGTTKFMRPLPGANRMYPESDLLPISVTKEVIENIKRNLPESWDKKLQRFKSKLNLSELLAKEILWSDYLNMFERILNRIRVTPSIVANTFTNIVVDLRRRGFLVENLKEHHFIELFRLIKLNKLAKEGIPVILEELSKNPDSSLLVIIKEKNLLPFTKSNLVNLIKKKIQANKNLLKDKHSAFNILMGLVMKEVRGRIDGKIVDKVVKKEIDRLFS